MSDVQVAQKTGLETRKKGSLISAKSIPVLATLIVFAMLYCAASLHYKGFATAKVLADIIVDNSFYGIVAVGLTMVIISGGIDLSVGGVVALCTVVMARMIGSGVSPLVSWAAAIAIGLGMGVMTGCAVRYFKIEPFIATLAGLFLARGISLIITTAAIDINSPFISSLNDRGVGVGPIWLPIPGVVVLAVVVIGGYITYFTPFGRNLFAIGSNEDAAFLMGLPVGRTKVMVYALSGLCCSIAAIVLTIYKPSGDPVGVDGMEMDAIAMSVIGGTLLSGGAGNVVGTFVGMLIYGIIQAIIMFQGDVNSYWTRVVMGGLLLVFVVLQRIISGSAYRKS